MASSDTHMQTNGENALLNRHGPSGGILGLLEGRPVEWRQEPDTCQSCGHVLTDIQRRFYLQQVGSKSFSKKEG